MTKRVRAATAELHVSYGFFQVRDLDGQVTDQAFEASNGLVGTDSTAAVVLTGISSGPVNLTVELLETAPDSVDLDDWDEVIEVSVDSEDGELLACGDLDTPPGFMDLSHTGPGTYRLRVHARGRDTAPKSPVDEPVEDYKISVWPAPEAADTIYKHSDEYGQEIRTTRS